MAVLTGPAKERALLADSARLRWTQSDEDDDLQPARRVSAGKVTSGELDALPRGVRSDLAIEAGKATRQGDRELTPAQALAYSQWLIDRPRVDRRAQDSHDADGALASAFEFIDESRGGQSLPAELAARLGDELGVDLARVRVHTDDR